MSKQAQMRAELGAPSTTKGVSGGLSLIFLSFIASVMLLPIATHAKEPATIDDLGFNAITDDRLFSEGVKLQGNSVFKYGNRNSVRIKTSLDANPIDETEYSFRNTGIENLDLVTSSYRSQGFKVNRLSTSWQSDSGTLTVGNEWTSFQDVLRLDKQQESAGGTDNNRSVASQVKWLSPNGFSISLEDSPETSKYLANDSLAGNDGDNSSPSLILSWQGGPGGTAGEYRVTAMGKKFDAAAEGQKFDGSDILGWGLNLEGGWQLGDLFAALSVTFGKGINSYILQRFGSDLLVRPNNLDTSTDSLAIQPSLYFSLNNNSNFHVSLGRYTSEESFNNSGIDTLDTVHMGYSWNPWPSTKFGLELVGQNTDGPNVLDEESTQVKFGAQKRF
jgi:hypothetical protein